MVGIAIYVSDCLFLTRDSAQPRENAIGEDHITLSVDNINTYKLQDTLFDCKFTGDFVMLCCVTHTTEWNFLLDRFVSDEIRWNR